MTCGALSISPSVKVSTAGQQQFMEARDGPAAAAMRLEMYRYTKFQVRGVLFHFSAQPKAKLSPRKQLNIP
jgi:hypothetical protein